MQNEKGYYCSEGVRVVAGFDEDLIVRVHARHRVRGL